jgi:hypothetical protein
MRRFFVALTICFFCFSARGQKTRYGQEAPHAKPGVIYPIKVHVSGVHDRTSYVGAGQYIGVTYVDAIIDGKKIELQVKDSNFEPYNLPTLGDHQARLLKDPHKRKDTPLFREYELLLSDNTVWPCTVTGISE